MRRTIVICVAVITFLVLGLAVHWAAWELISEEPDHTQVRVGSFEKIAGLNIHLRHEGEGYPVILLHGFSSDLYSWRFNVSELGRSFSIWAIDLPGFGYSDKPGPGEFDYSVSGYADFLVKFMEAKSIKKAVLVGNSFGGNIGLMICLRYPSRVAGLVLIGSGGYPKDKKAFSICDFQKYPIAGDILMSFTYRPFIRMFMEPLYHDPKFVTDDVVDHYYDVYKIKNARTATLRVGNAVNWDHAIPGFERIRTISLPTLIIWGGSDRVVPPDRAYRFKSDIAGSRLLLIHEAGHVPHEEKSGVFNRAVTEFVKRVQ